MNADGSGVKRLTTAAAHDEDPAWSPDGKRIAFVSSVSQRNGEIYVMNANGTAKKRLTHHAPRGALSAHPLGTPAHDGPFPPPKGLRRVDIPMAASNQI